MRTIIKNVGKLYTGTGNSYLKGPLQNLIKVYSNIDIEINNSIITKIEPDIDVKKADLVIDAKNKIVLPGFVDSHTHPIFGGNRVKEFIDRVNGKPYEEITKNGGGINHTLKMTRKASYEDIKLIAKNNIRYFSRYGTTTIEAKSGYALNKEGEIKLLKILNELKAEMDIDIVITYLGGHLVPKGVDRSKFIKELFETIDIVSKEKLADFFDIWIENIAFSVEEGDKIIDYAIKKGLKIRIHANELGDAKGGLLAEKHQIISIDHFDYFTEKELEILSRKEVNVTLLPLTQFILGTEHYPDVKKIIKKNIPISLATDFNPGTSPSTNMIFLAQLSFLKMNMDIYQILNAITINPAKNLGLSDRIGTIEIGKYGDFVIYDAQNIEELFYYIGMNKILYTIKKGKIIYRSDNEN